MTATTSTGAGYMRPQDEPAEVAAGGHQFDGRGDLVECVVDVLRIQSAGGEQVLQVDATNWLP